VVEDDARPTGPTERDGEGGESKRPSHYRQIGRFPENLERGAIVRPAMTTPGPARTLVVIPAFNESAALPATIGGLRRAHPELDVLVVDDGSTDGTGDVARSLGVEVLSLPFNLGIGGALRCGFRFAVRQGYQRALQFDADGQHDPAEIETLLAPLDDGADLVIGCRFAGSGEYQVGRSRRLAMGILRLLARWLTGRRFNDTSSGFRAFSRRMLERFATEYPVEYMDSVEALVQAVREGYDVREVPAAMRERAAGEASTRRFRLAYHYVRLLVVLGSSRRNASGVR
jgi:glycosyltransferase involved in cell wall biosynthesis